MKRAILILFICFPVLAYAQATERIYVSTDRDVYISGDDVWCSLFCIDKEKGCYSDFSAIAYLELISTEETAATAKIGLLNGRGAGKFRIPDKTPTGNYKLVAYTALNVNENSRDFFAGAKTLSIFNTTSTARVSGGVNIVSEEVYPRAAQPEDKASPNLSVSVTGAGKTKTLAITNHGPAASVSLSVSLLDDIVPPANGGIASFLESIKAQPLPTYTQRRLPEYEGEIVYAAVEGMKKEGVQDLSGTAIATLSCAGSPSDVYTGKVQDDGRILFFTNNIYGDHELVCDISQDNGTGYISLLDNFLHPEPEPVPQLLLSRALNSSLITRKAALGIRPQADTLLTYLSRRQDGLLASMRTVSYHLDDYTRFNTLEEVIVEIVQELRLKKSRKGVSLEMTVQDPSTSKKTFKENLLIMLDGVALSSLSLIENIDAMLLEDIDLYTDSFAMGSVAFDGAVNFVTGKDYVTALHFPDRVRVADFKGVSYPVAYRGAFDGAAEKDLRQLLYWEPILEIGEGETVQIHYTQPTRSELFSIRIEGLTKGFTPI